MFERRNNRTGIGPAEADHIFGETLFLLERTYGWIGQNEPIGNAPKILNLDLKKAKTAFGGKPGLNIKQYQVEKSGFYDVYNLFEEEFGKVDKIMDITIETFP